MTPRSLVLAALLVATILFAPRASSADEAEPKPVHRSASATERARLVSYVAMAGGAAAIATGITLNVYGTAHFPDGCTLQSCDLRSSDGAVSNGGAPCARDLHADGCVGSDYNVHRQADAARAHTMQSAGAVTAIAGALAFTGGFVLWLRTPSREKAAPDRAEIASAQVMPVVGFGFGGVGVNGAF